MLKTTVCQKFKLNLDKNKYNIADEESFEYGSDDEVPEDFFNQNHMLKIIPNNK